MMAKITFRKPMSNKEITHSVIVNGELKIFAKFSDQNSSKIFTVISPCPRHRTYHKTIAERIIETAYDPFGPFLVNVEMVNPNTMISIEGQ
jgi:hypothetical protein